MRQVAITIEGITAYSSSQHVERSKSETETFDDYEKRIWPEKAHVDDGGNVFIPGVAFKMCFDTAAQQLKMKVEGGRGATFGKLFQSGIVALDDMFLGIKIDDVKSIRLYCHSGGSRTGLGSGTRVFRYFPYIPKWAGKVTMALFSDKITAEVFERTVTQAGLTAGVGRGRPETGCAAGNGRFKPVKFEWSDV
jgi:hypothetical protein